MHIYVTYNWSYFVLSVFFLLTQGLPARVQADSDEKGLNEKLRILIDKGRVEKSIGNVDTAVTSSSYSVIQSERFRNSFVSLPDIIEQEVGVQIRSGGGEGSLSTVLLRGANSEQVVIYLDGVPLNNASGGSVDLSLISLDNVERIEVYRGSTPLELGNPSIAGAVNIITRQFAGAVSENKSNLSATVASFQTYKVSGSSTLVKDNNQIYIGAAYLQSNNDFNYNNDNGTPDNTFDDRDEKRQNDGVEHLTALMNWKHIVSSELDTELRLDVSDRNKELPGVLNGSGTETFVETKTYNLLGQLNVRQAGFENFNINVKVFASQKDEIFDDSIAQLSFFDQRTESVTKKLGSQVYAEIIKPQQHWKFLSGISREDYDVDSSLPAVQSDVSTRDQFESSIESVSYFSDEQLIVNVVIRYQLLTDKISTVTNEFGVSESGFEKNYKFVNPQIGFRYRFNNHTFVTSNIGQYHRAPSFVELFGGGGLFLGNPDLKAEESLNVDLGYTYTWFKPSHWLHNAEIYGGVFYNQIDNLIVRIFNGQGVGTAQNISDAVIQGMEMSVKLKPFKHHTISSNLNFIDSNQESNQVAFDEKKLPGYYQTSFLLRYAYDINKWLFSIEADIKRDMFYDRANLLRGDDVNLYNAGIRYLFKQSNIDFRVNNILNENIQYFRNRPTPGLNVSLTFNTTF
ncbi:TonB-dependent receptor [hydrothermal vent metagenome]|uniref:TonB-dependent receptor n=1 Tax=hydrothermal vent metagenome TaxID=652676 RepID=A0A3B0WMX1_9ZZZZ